ncbi:MAG: transposase [Acidimicrobiia bacterium]|nr:transposase [Acidimicrobiia bacterium]
MNGCRFHRKELVMRLAAMGVDTHLGTVTAAVVGPLSEELDSVTVPNTSAGWDKLVGVCHRHGVGVVGVEGASGYGRGLAQRVVSSGLRVREIPTRLTSRVRRLDGAGKSDPVDARAIGRATARGEGSEWVDAPDLETIRVLVHRRDALVKERTRSINELRALLTEIDPARAAEMGRLRSRRQFCELAQVEYHGDNHRETVGMLIGDLAEECLRRCDQIRHYKKRIEEAIPPVGEELMGRGACPGVCVSGVVPVHVFRRRGVALESRWRAG